MSQSQGFDPQVEALFSAYDQAGTFAGASANNGEGLRGEWPPEGTHQCTVDSIEVKPSKVKGGGGEQIACAEIAFHYTWLKQETDEAYSKEEPTMAWKGERFLIIPNREGANIKEGFKTGLRIGEERLKGHLSKLLEKAPEQITNFQAAIREAIAKVGGANKVVAEVKVQARKDKADANKTYWTEFLSGILSS